MVNNKNIQKCSPSLSFKNTSNKNSEIITKIKQEKTIYNENF